MFLLTLSSLRKMAHVYRVLAGALGHFWRSQSGISVRNGSIGVDLLDRSILCRLSVFAGDVRSPIATQTSTELVYLNWDTVPYHCWMGESLFQRWIAGTGMVFCGQYSRKGLHILRRECA